MRARPVAGLVAAMTAGLLLAGCSSQQPAASTSGPASTSATSTTAQRPGALPASLPAEISIPKIGASSSLIQLGLNPDETIEVPPVEKPLQAGWYRYSPTPGELGPSIILGHVNGGGQAGIFARLHELSPGDEVLVGRQDSSTARFVVRSVEQVAKVDFSAQKVYGDTAAPELRLITCGGEFDRQRRSYRDNVIVYAALAG